MATIITDTAPGFVRVRCALRNRAIEHFLSCGCGSLQKAWVRILFFFSFFTRTYMLFGKPVRRALQNPTPAWDCLVETTDSGIFWLFSNAYISAHPGRLRIFQEWTEGWKRSYRTRFLVRFNLLIFCYFQTNWKHTFSWSHGILEGSGKT